MRRGLTPLKRVRLELGLLQLDVAHDARIHPSRLSQLETGRQTAREDELKRLAQVFHVPVAMLRQATASQQREQHA